MISYLAFILFQITSILCCDSNNNDHSLRLLSQASGALEAGNYSHYSLNDRGSFKLVLRSVEGDADLYMSINKHQRVDYTNYDLQSTTYGDDIIYINEHMHRPIYISVYAHPYYYATRFTLSQYEIDTKGTQRLSEFNDFYSDSYFHSANDEFKQIDDAMAKNEKSFYEHYESHHNQKHHDHRHHHSSIEKSVPVKFEEDVSLSSEESEAQESIFWSLFIHLLEFVAEVLL